MYKRQGLENREEKSANNLKLIRKILNEIDAELDEKISKESEKNHS